MSNSKAYASLLNEKLGSKGRLRNSRGCDPDRKRPRSDYPGAGIGWNVTVMRALGSRMWNGDAAFLEDLKGADGVLESLIGGFAQPPHGAPDILWNAVAQSR